MKVNATIYNLASGTANSFMKSFLSMGGIYHVGIEVAGIEWSYGYCESGSGVFAVEPMKCTLGPFHEQVELGETSLRVDDIIKILHKMRTEWLGPDYNVASRNCVFFSQELIQALSPGMELPEYCSKLSKRALSMVGSSVPTRLKAVKDVFGSPEKELMWREAERLMRDFERDGSVIAATYPRVLHSIHVVPPDHTPMQTRNAVVTSYYHIRYQHLGGYLSSPATRHLLLNFR